MNYGAEIISSSGFENIFCWVFLFLSAHAPIKYMSAKYICIQKLKREIEDSVIKSSTLISSHVNFFPKIMR